MLGRYLLLVRAAVPLVKRWRNAAGAAGPSSTPGASPHEAAQHEEEEQQEEKREESEAESQRPRPDVYVRRSGRRRGDGSSAFGDSLGHPGIVGAHADGNGGGDGQRCKRQRTEDGSIAHCITPSCRTELRSTSDTSSVATNDEGIVKKR